MSTGVLGLQECNQNLQMLHAAALHSERVVANWSGSRLYTSSSAWGRVWTVIYTVGSWMGLGGRERQACESCIQRTEQAFHSATASLWHDMHTFRGDVMSRTSKGDRGSSDCAARASLTNWSNSLGATSARDTLDKVQEYCAQFFPTLQTQWTLLEGDQRLVGQVRAYQAIIDLESRMGDRLPYALLTQLATDQSFSEAQLKAWLESLDRVEGHVDVRLLHRALSAFVMHCREYHRGDWAFPPSIERLESGLRMYGCSLLDQRDPIHIASREKFLSQGTVTVGGESRRLLPYSSPQSDETSHFLLRSIEGNEASVLMFADNAAQLGIEQVTRVACWQPGIEPAHIIGVDARGRWAEVEKLAPLDNEILEWSQDTSHRPQWLDGLTTALNGWMSIGQMPKRLNLDQFGVTSNGTLRSYHQLTLVPFSRLAFMDFIAETAGGLPELAQILCQDSGFTEDPIFHFYSSLVTATARGKSFNFVDELACYELAGSGLIIRGKEMEAQIWCLKESGYSAEEIIQAYHDAWTPGYCPLEPKA